MYGRRYDSLFSNIKDSYGVRCVLNSYSLVKYGSASIPSRWWFAFYQKENTWFLLVIVISLRMMKIHFNIVHYWHWFCLVSTGSCNRCHGTHPEPSRLQLVQAPYLLAPLLGYLFCYQCTCNLISCYSSFHLCCRTIFPWKEPVMAEICVNFCSITFEASTNNKLWIQIICCSLVVHVALDYLSPCWQTKLSSLSSTSSFWLITSLMDITQAI